MPLPVIPTVYRCAFNWVAPAGTQHATNVMHFQSVGGDEDDVHAALNTNAVPGMFGQVVDGANVSELVVQHLDGVSAAKSYSLGSSWVGASAGTDTWVPQASMVLTLKTGLSGRTHRGRVYLPFIDEGAISNGSIVASVVTLAGIWNTFRAAMATDAVPWVVASYSTASAAQVTNVVINAAAGTQRRRQSRLR